jgi:AcrR family transcriptional regulator
MVVSHVRRTDSNYRRPRRKVGEIRLLLLTSARELFCSQGYSNTSTRDIAQHAGVSETHLYRHFGSKAGLFEEAVFQPFEEFAAEFIRKWDSVEVPSDGKSQVGRDYLEGLYKLLHEHRDSLMALLNAHSYEVWAKDGDSPLVAILGRLDTIIAREATRLGYPEADVGIAARVAVAMVGGMVLLEEWLFSGSRRPNRARLIDGLLAVATDGISGLPNR